MFMKFIGAAEGVTGSCTWLYHPSSDTQILVDCGLFQGKDHEEFLNYQPFEFDPKAINYVLLTHAHIDHCGLIGKLVRKGFRGKVYCTSATESIAKEMLLDSAKMSDVDYYNKQDVENIKWKSIDVHSLIESEHKKSFKWGEPLLLANGLAVSAWRSSHVLGACGFSINWNEEGVREKHLNRSIFFSGDIGNQMPSNMYLPMMKKNHVPPPYSDYIVVESTYGSRVRDPQYKNYERRIEALEAAILSTKDQGGTLLIPAFAFHRTQEILTDLFTIGARWKERRKEGDIKCYLDSPLSNRLNAIYGEELPRLMSSERDGPIDRQYLRDDVLEKTGIHPCKLGELFSNLSNGNSAKSGRVVVEPSDGTESSQNQSSKKNKKPLNYRETLGQFDVVIASGGMCDKGTVNNYISLIQRSTKNAILLSGFQASGSKGRELLDMDSADLGCQLVNLSSYYSGHADQTVLLDYLFELGKRKDSSKNTHVFINHGEAESKKTLEEAIQKRAQNSDPADREISTVSIGQKKWFNLSESNYEERSPIPRKEAISSTELTELKALIEKQSKELVEIKSLVQTLVKEAMY